MESTQLALQETQAIQLMSKTAYQSTRHDETTFMVGSDLNATFRCILFIHEIISSTSCRVANANIAALLLLKFIFQYCHTYCNTFVLQYCMWYCNTF